MENKKVIVVGLLVLLLVLVGVYLSKRSGKVGLDTVLNQQQVSTAEPLDIVSDFYDKWLSSLHSSTTDPYKDNLSSDPLLSSTLRDKLNADNPLSGLETGVKDPVICQQAIPPNTSAKTLYVYPDEKAQVLVFTKGADQAGQAIVTLLAKDGGWYIDDILCSRGEFDVPREFTFEMEGHILKQVPPPYNPDQWHIVFTQDNQPGHVTPLIFDASSRCTAFDGTESTCDVNTFTEAKKIFVQAQMTELGAEVKFLKFLE